MCPLVHVPSIPVNGSPGPVIKHNSEDSADPAVDLGDNLLRNDIKAIPKMMVGEKADCVISLTPVAEHRTS